MTSSSCPSCFLSKNLVWIVLLVAAWIGIAWAITGRVPGAGSGETAAGIVAWQTDLAAAAPKDGDTRPTMLNFTASWCAPCAQMKRTTFSDQAVADRLESDFRAILVDIDTPQGGALAEQLGIQFVPTFVVLTADGQEVARRSGYVPTEDMLAWLKATEQEALAATPAKPEDSSRLSRE